MNRTRLYQINSIPTIASLCCAAILLLFFLLPAVPAAAARSPRPVSTPGPAVVYYLYKLSDFAGPKKYDGATLAIDTERNEIYTLASNSISVFDKSGMELFSMEPDTSWGTVYNMALLEDGSLLLLTVGNKGTRIRRVNYRGDQVGEIVLRSIPAGLSGFTPYAIRYRDGKLYLLGGPTLVIARLDGEVLGSYNLLTEVGIEKSEHHNNEIGDIAIDADGTVLFTLPVTGKVCRFNPATGTLESFGKRGSAAGGFGVPAGITVDRNGNIFITDKLRARVIVYRRDYKFVTEFGDIRVPSSIVADLEGRIYVNEYRFRGVNVFQYIEMPPAPPAAPVPRGAKPAK